MDYATETFFYLSFHYHNCVVYLTVFFCPTTDNPRCHLHQINGGEEEATVIGGNTATVMFEGTGPSPDNVVTDYRVILQIRPEPESRFSNVGERLCSEATSPVVIGPPALGMTVQCSVDANSEQTFVNLKLQYCTL